MSITKSATTNNQLDTERRHLVDIVRDFEQVIRDSEKYLENERRLPQQLANDLYDAGPFRAFMPQELGGLEVHPTEWLEMVEELSRINGSVGWLAMLHTGDTFIASEKMLELLEQDRWITAGNIGRAAGKAVPTPGGYRVTGKWPFSSGSPEANWLFGRSILYNEDGEQVTSPVDGNPWYLVTFFPREDVTLHDTWDGLGLRGTGSGHFSVDDVFVPKSMANERGIFFRNYDRALYRATFNLMAHGAHSLGLAVAAMEEYKTVVHRSAKHGSLRQARLGREQLDQYAIGEADSLVRAARLFLHETAEKLYNDAEIQWPTSYELRVRLHQANTFAVHSAKKAVDLVFERAGAPATFRGAPLERIFRDITVASQHALVSRGSLDRVGQYLLTKDLPGGPDIDITGIGHVQGPHPQFASKKLPKV